MITLCGKPDVFDGDEGYRFLFEIRAGLEWAAFAVLPPGAATNRMAGFQTMVLRAGSLTYREASGDFEPDISLPAPLDLEVEQVTERLSASFFRPKADDGTLTGLGDSQTGQTVVAWKTGSSFSSSWAKHSTTNAAGANYAEAGASMGMGVAVSASFLVHGGLMMTAWLLLAPVGAAVSRYAKSDGAKWFHVHRAVQCLALLLTVAGLIVIRLEDPHIHGGAEATHQALGSAVIALALLQGLMGFGRNTISGKVRDAAAEGAAKQGPRRWLFNRMHQVVGYTTIAVAFAAIVIAVNFWPSDDDLWFADEATAVLWVFAAGSLVFVLAMELMARKASQGNMAADQRFISQLHGTELYALYALVLWVAMMYYTAQVETQ